MDIDSTRIAAQNGLAVNPNPPQPQQQAEQEERQTQQASTELPRSRVVVRSGNDEAFAQADRFRQQQQPFSDQPDQRASRAISAYQSLSNNQQRDEIQQLLGVDTYA